MNKLLIAFSLQVVSSIESFDPSVLHHHADRSNDECLHSNMFVRRAKKRFSAKKSSSVRWLIPLEIFFVLLCSSFSLIDWKSFFIPLLLLGLFVDRCKHEGLLSTRWNDFIQIFVFTLLILFGKIFREKKKSRVCLRLGHLQMVSVHWSMVIVADLCFVFAVSLLGVHRGRKRRRLRSLVTNV